jgi:hypothetical protein
MAGCSAAAAAAAQPTATTSPPTSDQQEHHHHHQLVQHVTMEAMPLSLFDIWICISDQLATFQMEAFSWLLWLTYMPGVDWVCYAPLLFSRKDVPLGLFQTASKTSTIRCTIKKKPPSKTRKAGRKPKKILKIVPSGFSRGHWYGQQFWEAFRKRKWVRTVWNYSHTDQFGWALITQMYYVPFGSLPAATPTTEGFPEKTLEEFKGIKFFKLCSTHTEVLVIHFIWASLGPSTNPFPPCHHTTHSFLPNHAPTQPSAHTHKR